MNKCSSIGAEASQHRPRCDCLLRRKVCVRSVFTVAAFLLHLPVALTAQARDMSNLYSTQELETWQYILELQTQRNFEILLSQGLDEEEKIAAIGVRLEMPLRGRHNDLLEFYA